MTKRTRASREAGNPPAASASKQNDREQRVIRAALSEFAEKGFDGATWRSIADRAGVSQGLIKFYFSDKEGLWQAALLHAHDSMSEDLPPPPFEVEKDPDRDLTEEWIRAYVRHAAKHPDYFKMIMREAAAPNPRISWAAQNVRRFSHGDFQHGLELLQKRGYFPGMNPILLQYAFLGAAHQPFLASEEIRAIYGVDTTTNKMIEAHADALISLFLGPRDGD
ncbi:TetR/AcrR family transcriptional regulator [Pseudohalioglobus sediminis]|uniref:TetR/AcrR family transcriptional regulator n=1 Tax=Pseudohalioglobus sediminis TaxID=2606449 RepID=A0A5B0WZJ6_9GAMM|nr:TetR/AcrR family transcriptional regulator [Pseudohalioglobus sediminis]KAA1192500.1 TetR/AcrR family transcriptional regulator [Pseudohalioglobus sediminis]